MATSSCPQRPTFRPWGCITSMMHFLLKEELETGCACPVPVVEEELASDLRLTADAVLRMQWANTKNNPKLPLLVQQDERESHKASLPQNKGRRNKVIRRRRQASPALIQRSDEQDGSPQDNTRTPLSEDSHQHGLMLAAYRDVGNEYAVDREQLRKELRGWFRGTPFRSPLQGGLKGLGARGVFFFWRYSTVY